MKTTIKINFKLLIVFFLLILYLPFKAHGQKLECLQITAPSEQILQLYKKSLIAMKEGDTKKTILLLNKTLDIDSTFFMGNFQLLLYEMYFSNQAKMDRHIKLALKARTELSRGEQLLYNTLNQLKFNSKINLIHAVTRLTIMFPNDEEVWYILGSLQIINQQYYEALNTYKELLDKTDNPAAVYNRIGYIHMFLGNYKKAELAFNKYIELNPEHPNPWDSKGDFFIEIKEFEQAYNCYMRAFSLDTNWSRDKAMKAKWKSLSKRY